MTPCIVFMFVSTYAARCIYLDVPVFNPGRRITQEIFKKACDILRKRSDKWWDIGVWLGFTTPELDSIRGNPLNLSGGSHTWQDRMLSDWFEWAPKDARGSISYATLHSLRTAVDKAGLGATAEDLDELCKQ